MDTYPPNKRVDLRVVWYSIGGDWILDGVYDDEELRDRRIGKRESEGRVVEYRRLMTCTPEKPRKYRAHRGVGARELHGTHHW